MEERVGPYSVVAVAHEGDLTTVYRCRDVGVDRDVALKVARPGLIPTRCAEAHRRLRIEAEVRGRARHPNILALYRLVDADPGPLLVGPWVDGDTLADAGLGQCPLSVVLAVAEGIGGALDALHDTGWWHGDLGAANVLLSTLPDRIHPLLADFGTARRVEEPASRDGDLVMTPAVTAPEVWTGGGGPAGDRYSLGVLLYLTLTGTYPFTGDATEHYRDQHLRTPVPPPSTRAAGLGPATDAALLAALAKDPATRPESGQAIASALRDALATDGLVRSRSVPPTRSSTRGSRITPELDQDAVQAAGARLEQFAMELDERERAALAAMLELARTQGARAAEEVGQLAMRVFGPAGALVALDESGAARILAAGPASVADVSAACNAPQWALGRVLALLATTGVLERHDDGRYALMPALEAVYRSHLALESDVRPLADAAALWGQLPRWAATGEPALVMDDLDGVTYAQNTLCLGVMFTDDAARLASILISRGYVRPEPHVLDVGAGSAVWSLAIVAAAPAAVATALDRPLVLETARIHAAAAGLTDRLYTLAGDWRDVPLPVAGYDVAILANICHLEVGDDVARLLARVASALQPNGVAVIVDTIPERVDDDPGVLLQSIHLGLRSRRGGIHDRRSYVRWLEAAGLEAGEVVSLRAQLGALVAHKRSAGHFGDREAEPN